MEEAKQEGQKTVVAFIAGLLIGGLLVWVFSASPDSDREDGDENVRSTTGTTVVTEGGDDNGDGTVVTETPDSNDNGGETPAAVVTGEGSIVVNDQPAGGVVAIADITYPTTDGWIVVHENVDGEPGRALGASRYSTGVGLLPQQVELLRTTDAGSAYYVLFHSENGDRVFDLADDAPLTRANGDMVGTTFNAQ